MLLWQQKSIVFPVIYRLKRGIILKSIGGNDSMVRKIIHIDKEKCNGFGDCLPGCPTGAITFEEREAPAYDEAAVMACSD